MFAKLQGNVGESWEVNFVDTQMSILYIYADIR